MPALPLSRRALAALALVFALPALAEDWPDTDWPRAQQPAGPALEAFERYAFGRRDDVRRKGIRTDAVVVIRDGRLVYERNAGPAGCWARGQSVSGQSSARAGRANTRASAARARRDN
ncbi:hypothetical protein Q4R45_22430, partial [Morganella morganii subsp. sibonii]